MEKEIWYKKVANLIVERVKIDLSEDTEGCPNISHYIAWLMLKDKPAWTIQTLWADYAKLTENALHHAIYYIEDTLKMPVYRRKSKGGEGRNIEFITIDSKYRDAYDAEYERIWKNWEGNTNRTKERIELVAPRRIARFLTEGQMSLAEKEI